MIGASRGAVRFHSTRPKQGFLTNIRIQVAKALTDSLSPDLRRDILADLGPPDVPATKETPKPTPSESGPTIAEAVAAARREEAAKHEKLWKEQRENILREAEEAAKHRIENDIAVRKRQLAFQQWEKELEKEKEVEKFGGNAVNMPVKTDDVQPKPEDHPVLGELVLDLGYKRIYRASAATLVNIPVWEKQRIYRHDRAKQMASDKMKSLDLGLPGVITIHESKDGTLTILDGQHRIGMLSLLTKKEGASHFIDSVLVEVYSSAKENFSKELFVEINKAEPVKLVDMPGIAKSSERNILSNATASLRDNFPEMFKPSQKCRMPHLNEDNVRDALFAAKVLERHKINTPSALYEWMMHQNEKLGERFKSDPEAKEKVPKTAIEKALKHGFYLGLDSTWYYN